MEERGMQNDPRYSQLLNMANKTKGMLVGPPQSHSPMSTGSSNSQDVPSAMSDPQQNS